MTPSGYDVRTQIYEYGGSAFLVHEGVIFFLDAVRGWMRQDLDGRVTQITEAGPVRYGSPVFDPLRGRIICIREDFRGEGEPENTLVAIDPRGDSFGTVLVSGDDFYSWPILSPDGRQMAWSAWNHPNVPWDATALRTATFDASGRLGEIVTVVGETDEVACDPQFLPNGELIFVSDRSDWWNYYGWRDGVERRINEAPIDFARPLWQMGTSDFRVADSGALVAVYTRDGINHLGRVRLADGGLEPIDLPYTYLSRLRIHGRYAYLLASSPSLPAVVARVDMVTGESLALLQASSTEGVEHAISTQRHIAFPSAQGRTGYGFYYPPVNGACRGPIGAKPPLLMFSHGGPTGCTNTCFNPGIQFWTSRGFAVFDINYAGSTGYGRPFRHLLRGGWGVVDVEDHVAAARYLSEAGLVDPERLAVRGWSAGGYNTFAALAFADTFHAGAAYFGISDVTAFADQTHKFESHYAEYLVGPRATSEALYRERSPLYSADRITAPLAMFQGEIDKITPKNQSEMILESLRARQVPVMYMLFEGEGHGFRKAETNLACLRAELAFYGQVFGFNPADDLPPIALENAERLPGMAKADG